jgi:hypothetical protein
MWDTHRHVGTFIARQTEDFLCRYWRDLLQSQPNHLELLVEKNTVAAALRQIAAKYTLPMTSGRGYSSLPPRKAMVDRFHASEREKLIVVVVSDFDAEGQDISNAFGLSLRDDFGIEPDRLVIVKAALTHQQTQELDLHEGQLAKEDSARYQRFVDAYGDRCWELEAAPPIRCVRSWMPPSGGRSTLMHLKRSAANNTNGPRVRETYKHTRPCAPVLPLSLPPLPAVPSFCIGSEVFRETAANGALYELLMEPTGLNRDSVKYRFLVDVLAKRGRYPSRVESAFRQLFPSVSRFIKSVNRDDHGALIRLLQRMESWLVIEQVAPRLVGQIRTLTLHDAIYSRLEHEAAIVGAFHDVFDRIGFRLALSCERNCGCESSPDQGVT